MTDYTQGTFFGFRDSLPVGSPKKKGNPNLFESEFDTLVTESSTKSDLSVPAIAGQLAKLTSSGGLEAASLTREAAFVFLSAPEEIISDTTIAFGDLNTWTEETISSGDLFDNGIKRWRVRINFIVEMAAGYTASPSSGGQDTIWIATRPANSSGGEVIRKKSRLISTVAGTDVGLVLEADYESTTAARLNYYMGATFATGDYTDGQIHVHAIGYYPE